MGGQVTLIRLVKVTLGYIRLGLVRLAQVRLGWVRLSQVQLGWVRLGWVRLSQVRLGWVRSGLLFGLVYFSRVGSTFRCWFTFQWFTQTIDGLLILRILLVYSGLLGLLGLSFRIVHLIIYNHDNSCSLILGPKNEPI